MIVRLAKELKLPIGAHLSAEQAAALTSNVVILETREVTTPSGRQQVLVPIVYLAHVQPGDLQANGPLIAAKDIGLFDSKGFSNQGAVIARNSLTVTMAQDATLNNTGGTLQAGGLLQLGTTNTDIDLTSARVKAGDLTIVSGKDLILSTASQERTTVSAISTRTQTDLGRTASIEVSHDANLTTAGDFTQNAGQIKVGGNLNADIGGSYNLGTVAQTDHQTADYKRSRGTSVKTDITRTTQQTSSIEVGGDATIIVGQDINTKGARLASEGDLTLYAGRDINIGTADNTSKSDMAFQNSQGGGLMGGSKKAKSESHEQSSESIGSRLSGKNVALLTGEAGTLTTQGAEIRAGEDLTLVANTIVLDAAYDSKQSTRSETGKKRQLQSQESEVSAKGNILQAGNDLSLQSQGDTYIVGSALAAGNKASIVSGGNLALLSAESSEHRQISDYKETKKRATTLSYQEDSVSQLLGTISVGNELEIKVGGDFSAQTPEMNPDGSFKADRMTVDGIVKGDSRQQVSITRTGVDASVNPTNSQVKGDLKTLGIRNGANDSFTPKTSQAGNAALAQYVNSGLVQIKNNPVLSAKIDSILKDTGGATLTYKDDNGKISLTVAGQAKVQEVYNTLKLNETFDTKKITDQGTAQIVTLVVAIALTVCTAGAGAALIGAQTALTATMANAAFIGMVSTMTGQLAGGASFEEAFEAGVKAGATSALMAGVSYGISEFVNGTPPPSTIDSGGQTVQFGSNAGTAGVSRLDSLTTLKYWEQTGLNALAKGALSKAQGGSFQDGVTGSIIGSLGATGAGIIGDLTQDSPLTNILSHAALGCAIAAAGRQDCASGALGGAASATLARVIDSSLSGTDLSDTTKRTLIATGSVSGSMLIAAATGQEVLTAGNAAANEVTNNYLSHRQVGVLGDKLKSCGNDKVCQQNTLSDALALSEKQSGWTRKELDAYYKQVDTWAGQASNDCANDLCRQQVASWSLYTKLQSSGSVEMTEQNLKSLQILVRESNAGVIIKDIALPIGVAALNFLPVAGTVFKVGGGVAPRVFTSTDPIVGKTASTIDEVLPGVVKDVNVPIKNTEIGLSSDADIMLKNGDVIEVKSGGGKGATTQVVNQTKIIGDSGEVIVYGPELKQSVINGIKNSGTKVFTNLNDLITYIKSKGL